MKIALLSSWGGHLQEMEELRDAWGKYDYKFITYKSERVANSKEPMELICPPWTSKIRFLWDLTKTLIHLMFDRPDVLISTGMGHTDIFLFPFCKFFKVYTIYIESAANVDYISGTASFVKRFADKFIVQWEDLAEEIDAEYHGGII